MWFKKKVEKIIGRFLDDFVIAFNNKRNFSNFLVDFRDLENKIKTIENKELRNISFNSIITCDECKCLVFKNNAFKMPSTVELGEVREPNCPWGWVEKEIVKEHYLCLRCKKDV
jgi:hypothetical protein